MRKREERGEEGKSGGERKRSRAGGKEERKGVSGEGGRGEGGRKRDGEKTLAVRAKVDGALVNEMRVTAPRRSF